jgi:hypothetical protein
LFATHCLKFSEECRTLCSLLFRRRVTRVILVIAHIKNLGVRSILHILPGESDTRLENSNLFTCHAYNHLYSYPRSKPMSNNPGLDLDHHVPQHILQSVGSIYNLEGCHIAGCTLKNVLFNIHLWSLFSVQVFWSLSQVKANLFSE